MQILIDIRHRYPIAFSSRIRSSLFRNATCHVRFIGQGKGQGTTLHQLFVSDEVLFNRLAIEGHSIDIDILGWIVGSNGQGLAIGQLQIHLFEDRSSQGKFIATRTYRIKAHGTHDIPCRHLTAVFIAHDTFRSRCIHFIEQTTGHGLCLPRLTDIIIKVCHVMTWFIAMRILTNQAGNIRSLTYHSIRGSEQIIQIGCKGSLASEELNHAVYIVRYKETILPCSRFGKFMSYRSRIELFFPVAVQTLAMEETDIAIEYIAIVQGTFHVFLVNVFLTHRLRHLSNGPVIVCVFQQARNRFTLDVGWNETVLSVIVRTFGILVGRNNHGFQCLFCIIATDALHVSIGNDGSRVIANHGTGLARRKWPDRKFASHFIHIKQRLNHVVHQFSIGQGHQRMPCTERIPSRESGIGSLSFRSLCNATIMATIVIVDVVGTVWYDQ